MNRPVILDAMVRIPLERLDIAHVEGIKDRLTLKTPDGSSQGFGESLVVEAWSVCKDSGYISVPRNWSTAKKFLRRNKYDDLRSDGHKISAGFNAEFRPGQREFVDELVASLRRDGLGATGQAATGFGKTVMGAALVAELKTTTLVLVHKESLGLQFQAAMKDFLGIDVGWVKAGRSDWEGKSVVVGTFQTLYRRDMGPDFYNYFGLVICDETHRVAARTFCHVLCKMNSRYRVGFTATPRRSDNLEDMIFWHMGEVGAVGKGQFLDCVVYKIMYSPQIPRNRYTWRGKESLAKLITALTEDEARNGIIVSMAANAARKGRSLLILSDRVAHLEHLCNRLRRDAAGDGAYTVDIYCAGSTKAKTAQRGRASGATITLATHSMAGEGLDLPQKDTLFLVTPKADVEQASGRIRRLYEGKKGCLVVDFCDQISFLPRLTAKRCRFYAAPGNDKGIWKIKEVRR